MVRFDVYNPHCKVCFEYDCGEETHSPRLMHFLTKSVFKMQFGTRIGRGPRKCKEGINRGGGIIKFVCLDT